MLRKRIIPCLLLSNHHIVKTICFSETKQISEPIYAIKIFNDYEADELIILDIDASKRIYKGSDHRFPYELIGKISEESWMPLTFGGGIRSIDEIRQIFFMGIEKVCISSFGIHEPSFITEAALKFGRQSIVVSIDYRYTESGPVVYTYGGLCSTGMTPSHYATLMEQSGAGEILLNCIDKDGTYSGYDYQLINHISSIVNIPVIALGGAGNYSDLKEALHAGADAVAAGSIFVFFGKKRTVLINYPDIEEKKEILNE
jgi:cyclase